MQDPERRSPRRRGPGDGGDEQDILQQEEHIPPDGIAPLPPGGSIRAIVTGLVAGLLGAALNIAITYLNSPLYQQASKEAKGVTSGLDYALLGLTCLTFLISLLFCFFAGYFTGKTTIRRAPGFTAGAIAGVVMFLVSFVTNFIPGYPGTMASQTNVALMTRGVIVSLVFLLIWLFAGGLLGLWGASRATRKHPYYMQHTE